MCGSDHPGEFKEKGAAIVSLVDRVAAKKFPNKEFGNCCPLVSVGFLHVSTRQSNETSLDFLVLSAWSRSGCETTSINLKCVQIISAVRKAEIPQKQERSIW